MSCRQTEQLSEHIFYCECETLLLTMDRKGKRTRKADTGDSVGGNLLSKAKKKHIDDEETHRNDTGQLDTSAGQGNKRKRPVPKEEKKRKKPRTDEKIDGQNRKERKKPMMSEGAKFGTTHNGDEESDILSSRSDSFDEQDDGDLTSEKEETDQDEPMDYAEEATVDSCSDSDISTSMLQPEGSKTQHEYARNYRSVETRQNMKPTTQQDRTIFYQVANASCLSGSEAHPCKTGKNIRRPLVEESYLDHTKIKHRTPHQLRQDIARQSNHNLLSSPNRKTPSQAQRTYTSLSDPSRNRKERTISGPSREDKSSSHSSKKICCLLLLLIIFVAVAVYTFVPMMDGLKLDVVQTAVSDVASSLFSSRCVKRKRSERFDILMQEQDTFVQQYPSLDESTVGIIAGASFDHVSDQREIVRPVVLLLVGKHGGKTNVNDVANSVATMYANVFSSERHENDIVGIIGSYFEDSSSDEVKKKVHRHIEEKFSDCSNIALITDVDKLPPCSSILLHSYCDNDSAPHKDAVFVFTMTLKTQLRENMKKMDVEKAVQGQLSDWWSRCPEEFSPDKIVAMHSRVANNIVII